ncbi:MAG: hypothetical protein ACI4CA_08510 [Bacteroides sp.]
MARFAQYYIKYLNSFGAYDWELRQQHLGALFERDDSIAFGEGEPSEAQQAKGEHFAKTYNHRVYHLKNNPNIIVMQFANNIDIPVEREYKPAWAKDEPSCFVLIDNRENLRTVAIQKRKKAFGTPGQVARILTAELSAALYTKQCYSLEILPEYYPEDLYQLWERLQQHTCALRFSVPQMDADAILSRVEQLKMQGKEYFDDSLMAPLLQLALEAKKANYRHLYNVMPEDKDLALYVDKSSLFIKNLITLSRATEMPVELVTKDAGTFKCFVEADEENTDKIVCREFDANLLEQLFTKKKKDGEALQQGDITRIEGEILEMLNGMKHEAEDKDGDQVA